MAETNLSIVQSYIESHSEAVARTLEVQKPEAINEILQLVPRTAAQKLFANMIPRYSARAIAAMSDDLVISMLEHIDINKTVAILRALDKSTRRPLIDRLTEKRRASVRKLLNHPEHTVGAWMSTDVLYLPESITVGEARERVIAAENTNDLGFIPVVNAKNSLKGRLPLVHLLEQNLSASISVFTSVSCASVNSRTNIHKLLEHSAWETQDNLVVVDKNGLVLGAIGHYQLRCALRQLGLSQSRSSETGLVEDLSSVYLHSMAAMLDGLFRADQHERGVL